MTTTPFDHETAASHAAPVADRLCELLGLEWPAVAMSFVDTPPPGVARANQAAPASCGYWARAARGEVFYTEAADHEGCPIGAYTHGAPLGPKTSVELEAMLGLMAGLGYVSPDEVPAIPRRAEPLGQVVYAPLAKAPVTPDLILVRGKPRAIMLLVEATRALGLLSETAIMGRPACAIIPATLAARKAGTSLACIGNRVYTALADDELYATLPAANLSEIIERLETILAANQALETYHRARA